MGGARGIRIEAIYNAERARMKIILVGEHGHECHPISNSSTRFWSAER